MTYILDLRKKIEPQVQVVEKIIFQKQPWYVEIAKVLLAILVVSTVVWGISKADDLIQAQVAESVPTSDNLTGIYGKVTATSTYALVLDDSNGSKYEGIDIFYADLTNLKTIKTNEDNPADLALSDINVGDTIIARGLIEGSKIDVEDIISFSATSSKTLLPEATSTATTTEETASSTATTTEEIATTTSTTTDETASSTATTTSLIETVSNTVGDIVDKVKDTVQNVIDTITGSSTATSTEPDATVTPEIIPPTPDETPAPDPEVTPPTPDAPPTDTPPSN